MSLLETEFEFFTIIDKTTIPDGYGGVVTKWIEGALIEAIAAQTNSIDAQIAQALTEIKQYNVYTRKNIIFRKEDKIKRLRDGKYFRITSDADDKATPRKAPLNLRVCKAVEWQLPDGEEDEGGEDDG